MNVTGSSALSSDAHIVIAERSLLSDRRVFAGTHLSDLDATAYSLAHDALSASLGAARQATALLSRGNG